MSDAQTALERLKQARGGGKTETRPVPKPSGGKFNIKSAGDGGGKSEGRSLFGQLTDVVGAVPGGLVHLAGAASDSTVGNIGGAFQNVVLRQNADEIRNRKGLLGSVGRALANESMLESATGGGGVRDSLEAALPLYDEIGASGTDTIGRVTDQVAALAPGGKAAGDGAYALASRESRLLPLLIEDIGNAALVGGAASQAVAGGGRAAAASRAGATGREAARAGLTANQGLPVAGRIPQAAERVASGARVVDEGIGKAMLSPLTIPAKAGRYGATKLGQRVAKTDLYQRYRNETAAGRLLDKGGLGRGAEGAEAREIRAELDQVHGEFVGKVVEASRKSMQKFEPAVALAGRLEATGIIDAIAPLADLPPALRGEAVQRALENDVFGAMVERTKETPGVYAEAFDVALRAKTDPDLAARLAEEREIWAPVMEARDQMYRDQFGVLDTRDPDFVAMLAGDDGVLPFEQARAASKTAPKIERVLRDLGDNQEGLDRAEGRVTHGKVSGRDMAARSKAIDELAVKLLGTEDIDVLARLIGVDPAKLGENGVRKELRKAMQARSVLEARGMDVPDDVISDAMRAAGIEPVAPFNADRGQSAARREVGREAVAGQAAADVERLSRKKVTVDQTVGDLTDALERVMDDADGRVKGPTGKLRSALRGELEADQDVRRAATAATKLRNDLRRGVLSDGEIEALVSEVRRSALPLLKQAVNEVAGRLDQWWEGPINYKSLAPGERQRFIDGMSRATGMKPKEWSQFRRPGGGRMFSDTGVQPDRIAMTYSDVMGGGRLSAEEFLDAATRDLAEYIVLRDQQTWIDKGKRRRRTVKDDQGNVVRAPSGRPKLTYDLVGGGRREFLDPYNENVVVPDLVMAMLPDPEMAAAVFADDAVAATRELQAAYFDEGWSSLPGEASALVYDIYRAWDDEAAAKGMAAGPAASDAPARTFPGAVAYSAVPADGQMIRRPQHVEGFAYDDLATYTDGTNLGSVGEMTAAFGRVTDSMLDTPGYQDGMRAYFAEHGLGPDDRVWVYRGGGSEAVDPATGEFVNVTLIEDRAKPYGNVQRFEVKTKDIIGVLDNTVGEVAVRRAGLDAGRSGGLQAMLADARADFMSTGGTRKERAAMAAAFDEAHARLQQSSAKANVQVPLRQVARDIFGVGARRGSNAGRRLGEAEGRAKTIESELRAASKRAARGADDVEGASFAAAAEAHGQGVAQGVAEGRRVAEVERYVKEEARLLRKLYKLDAKLAEDVAAAAEKVVSAPATYRPAIVASRAISDTLEQWAPQLDPASADLVRQVAGELTTTVVDAIDTLNPDHVAAGRVLPAGRGSAAPARKLQSQHLKEGDVPSMTATDQAVLIARNVGQQVRNEHAKRLSARFGGTADKWVDAADMVDADGNPLRGDDLVAAVNAASDVPMIAWNPLAMGGSAPNPGPNTLFMPQWVVDGFDAAYKKSGDFEQLLQTWIDKPTRWWKHDVLALSPRWHFGNVVGNVLMAWAGGVPPHRQVQLARDAWALTKGREVDGVGAAPSRLASSGVGAEQSMFVNLAQELGDSGTAPTKQALRMFEHPNNRVQKRVLAPFDPESKPGRAAHAVTHPIQSSYKMNGFVDDFTHNLVYLDRMKKGAGQEKAIKDALRIAGDFSNMTKFERSVIRRTLPFYSWMRHITGLTADLAVNHPYRSVWTLNLWTLFAEDDEQFGDIPSLRGAIQTGDNEFIRGANYMPFGTVLDFDFTNPGATIGGSANPFMKLGAESAFGIEFGPGGMEAMSREPGTGSVNEWGNETFGPIGARATAHRAAKMFPSARMFQQLRTSGDDRVVRYDDGAAVKLKGRFGRHTIPDENAQGNAEIIFRNRLGLPISGRTDVDSIRARMESKRRQRGG